MMLIVGLFIIPISILIIRLIKDFKTSSTKRKFLNLLLFIISAVFIIVTFLVNMEPFTFEIQTKEDYLIYTMIIFMFTPFLWIHMYQHLSYIFRCFRIKKNGKIKDRNLYKYYRDDLNKLSPSLLMFIRNFEIDDKKAVTSTILKLKLSGSIHEKDNKLQVPKGEKDLLKSEEMILDLISGKGLNKKDYEEEIKKESIELGYLKKSSKNIFFKIPKLFLTIFIPVIVIISSIKFDNYVFNKYKYYLKDGNRYVLVEDELGDIHFDHPSNFNDYYHGYIKEEKREFYDKSLVSAKKMSNKIVKNAMIYHTLDLTTTCLSLLIGFISIYKLIEQLMYINKSYIRTSKGTDVLNKSYALKNFLNDFSDIKSRKEEEIILWEYYLVYATALGVNIDINDKLIQKYVD